MELGELGKEISDSEIKELLRKESYSKQNDFEDETENSNKEDKQRTEDIANRIVDSANKYFLVKVLSPEITKNEKKKRKHKCLRLEGSNFRLGGIAPITRAIPSF